MFWLRHVFFLVVLMSTSSFLFFLFWEEWRRLIFFFLPAVAWGRGGERRRDENDGTDREGRSYGFAIFCVSYVYVWWMFRIQMVVLAWFSAFGIFLLEGSWEKVPTMYTRIQYAFFSVCVSLFMYLCIYLSVCLGMYLKSVYLGMYVCVHACRHVCKYVHVLCKMYVYMSGCTRLFGETLFWLFFFSC